MKQLCAMHTTPPRRLASVTPPRERRGETDTPLLPEEGWRAQRDGVVGVCLHS